MTLGYDASLFTGPAVNPKWEPTYIPEDVVSPISALWVDEGREQPGLAFRTRTPASAAAQVFADALARHHIKVQGTRSRSRAPSGAQPIARVRSAPLAEIVQHTLELSDNEAAEVLSRQTAVATNRPASFSGGAQAVRSVLRGLGVDMAGDRIYDGSGLSRDDRLTGQTLLSVLRVASAPATASCGRRSRASRWPASPAPCATGSPTASVAGTRHRPRQDRHPHRRARPDRHRHLTATAR